MLAGARQIGKTFSIRRLGEETFKYFVEVNFIETPDAVKIFQNVQSVDEIITRLSAFVTVPLVEYETLGGTFPRPPDYESVAKGDEKLCFSSPVTC